VQNWSTSNTYSWTPTAPGNFKIVAWARSSGNTVEGPENNAYGVVDFSVTPLSVTSLTADKASPQPGGTTILFTATAAGGVGPIQFKWWILPPNGNWFAVQNWSTSNTYSWTPTAPGNFKIVAWARSSGNTADAPEAYGVIDFTVTPLSVTHIGPFSDVIVTAEKPRSQVGSVILVEPNSICNGNTPCYFSIWEALNAATTGAEIIVAWGIYHEILSINSAKNITLEGRWKNLFLSGAPDPPFAVINGDVTDVGIVDETVLRMRGAVKSPLA
jgi:hypothetical protein